MKTIAEWLKELPEPYNRLALLRYKQHPIGFADSRGYRKLSSALHESFTYNYTPERFKFWKKIFFYLQDMENCGSTERLIPQLKISSRREIAEYEAKNGPLID